MVIGLARQKFEREAGGFRSRSVARFVGRSEGDDRIEPLSLQSLAVELGFTAGRREIAMGEREVWGSILCLAVLGWTDECVRPYVILGVFEIQADAMFLLQAIARNPLESRVGRLKGAVNHGIHRFAETFIFKTHTLGERAEHLDIRPAFAYGIHRLIGNLQ